MNFVSNFCTDVGITKRVNQDSLCIKQAQTSQGKILMAVICDGMGGMKSGEIASAMTVSAFSDWFLKELPTLLNDNLTEVIEQQWNKLIITSNEKIRQYGIEHDIQLGTTVTAVLILENGICYLSHVGDTRLYMINQKTEQITEDQTLVAREVRDGIITAEQAIADSRRSILLQCVGVSEKVYPFFGTYTYTAGMSFLLCTDGFWHGFEQNRMQYYCERKSWTSMEIEETLRFIVEQNKKNGEKDNITAILIDARE